MQLLITPKHLENSLYGRGCSFQIRRIFTDIGIETDYDSFDKMYSLAASRHPQRHVSVESFRNVLDEFQAEQLQKTKIVY